MGHDPFDQVGAEPARAFLFHRRSASLLPFHAHKVFRHQFPVHTHSAAGLVGLIPAAAYLALHTVEANVITPAVLGARFTMNPVLILLALSYFGWIWGGNRGAAVSADPADADCPR